MCPFRMLPALLVLLLAGTCAHAQPPGLALSWSVDLGPKPLWYRLEGVTLAGNGQVVVSAIGDLKSVSEPARNEIWVWQLDAAGKPVLAAQVEKPQKDSQGNALDSAVTGRMTTTTGDPAHTALIVDFVDGQPWLVPLTPDGGPAGRFEIPRTSKRLQVRSAIALTGGGYVLAAVDGKESVLIKLDATANAVWRKPCVHDLQFCYVSGDALADGGFVLAVGASGLGEQTSPLQGIVWIGRFDGEGAQGAERFIDGGQPKCSSLPDGRVALLWEVPQGAQKPVHVAMLDVAFDTIWDSTVLPAASALDTFEVAASMTGCAVGGSLEEKPFAALLDNEGKKYWEYWGQSETKSALYGLAMPDPSQVYLASSVFIQEEQEWRGMVRVRRFAVPASQAPAPESKTQ